MAIRVHSVAALTLFAFGSVWAHLFFPFISRIDVTGIDHPYEWYLWLMIVSGYALWLLWLVNAFVDQSTTTAKRIWQLSIAHSLICIPAVVFIMLILPFILVWLFAIIIAAGISLAQARSVTQRTYPPEVAPE